MTLNQLLIVLANRLIEIAENTADAETENELSELVEKIIESIQ